MALTADKVALAVVVVDGRGAALRAWRRCCRPAAAADVLARGAPPTIGRLVTALITRAHSLRATAGMQLREHPADLA